MHGVNGCGVEGILRWWNMGLRDYIPWEGGGIIRSYWKMDKRPKYPLSFLFIWQQLYSRTHKTVEMEKYSDSSFDFTVSFSLYLVYI